MKKHDFNKITFAGVILVCLVQLYSSTAFGLSPLGPPRSLLKEDQNAFSIDLGYSNMDLQTFGDMEITYLSPYSQSSSFTEFQIDNLKSTLVSARLDTNIFENWDIFFRLGISDGADEITEVQADGSTGHQYNDFDGGFGVSWGLGTRTTFYAEGNTTWGGLFQVNWMNPGDSSITDASDSDFAGDINLDYWEVQLAIGPTVQYNNFRIYGGPFLQFINGDLEISGTTLSDDIIPLDIAVKATHEIREESQLGAYLGAQFNLGNDNTLVTEIQFTSDIWGIGIGSTWKF